MAASSAWLQPYFPAGVPDSVVELMKDEGIPTSSIFRQITESELDELCSRVKIGHRVSLRNAYHSSVHTEHLYNKHSNADIETLKELGINEDDVILADVISLNTAEGETSQVKVYERKRAKNSPYLPKKLAKSEPKARKKDPDAAEFRYTIHCALKQKHNKRIVKVRDSEKKSVKKILIGASKTSDEVLNMLAEEFQVKDDIDSLSLVDSFNQTVTFDSITEYVASQRKRYSGCTRLYLLRSFHVNVQTENDTECSADIEITEVNVAETEDTSK